MPTNKNAPYWRSQNCPPIRGVRAETVPIKWLRAENVVGSTNQMAPCWKVTTVRAETVAKTTCAESVVKTACVESVVKTARAESVDRKK